ncbi:Mor transcription activator family protein [Candidatus Sororendozoicomonas aggregata]|uniref:Mor transcription activator family protein n=1 Tax=Candidatus Sororendozoicomonas aggregata TaxID=3073239 RepID=UPI002ED2D749
MDDLFGLDGDNHNILAHLDDEVVVDRRLWPKDLALLADTALEELRTVGIKDKESVVLMEKLLVAVSMLCGGRGYYMPKGERLRNGIRDRKIYQQHDGSTHGPQGVRALAKHYRLSENKIYDILREQRQICVAKLQPSLDL